MPTLIYKKQLISGAPAVTDNIEAGNMKPVTSNAVSGELNVIEYKPTSEITLWKQGKRVTGIIKASSVTMSSGIKDLGTVPQGLFPKTSIYVSAIASNPYTPVLVGILSSGIIRVYSDKSSLEYLYCNFTYYVD